MEISSKTAEEIDEEGEKENLKKIEAIFFVSGRFLSMAEIVSFSDLNPIIIKELIEKLKEKYNDNSSIEIVSRGEPGKETWKMDVRQEYSNLVNKFASGSSEFSKAEQGTLAII